MTLVIAGERSGVGKTTVTLALLASLQQRDVQVQSFKVGPDYIDPMFHQLITGHPSRNLDPVLTSETYIRRCVARHTQTVDYALIEGVMGLFDGANGETDWASTAHIARLLQCPVLLVLDCARLARSVAAIAHGYRSFDPRVQLAGVVLNRVGSDRHLELLKTALEPLNLPVLGVLRRQEQITIPDRHLGLVPTAELPDLQNLIKALGHLGETCFDWAALLPLLVTQPQTQDSSDFQVQRHASTRVRIAIAQDQAFSFYYPDNLELLAQMGAQLVPWSPLANPVLPKGIQGLYLGGGFPEMFASALAENATARAAVGRAIRAGMPTYAECGGLMYLGKTLTDFRGNCFPMVGLLPTSVVMAPRLTLGYRQAIACQASPLLTAGTKVWGHEFHRSRLTQQPESALFDLSGYGPGSHTLQPEGWRCHQLHASYVHLHWGDRPELPRRFLEHCARWVDPT